MMYICFFMTDKCDKCGACSIEGKCLIEINGKTPPKLKDGTCNLFITNNVKRLTKWIKAVAPQEEKK